MTGLLKLRLVCETLGLDCENLDWTVSLLGHRTNGFVFVFVFISSLSFFNYKKIT